MALHRYLVEEVAADCADGLVSRREAMRRLGLLGVGAASAALLLAGCGDDGGDGGDGIGGGGGTTAEPSVSSAGTSASTSTASGAATTAPADTATATPTGQEIRFAGPRGELIGVLAEAQPPKGGVLVIHENRGLTEHIRTLPARLAADGFTALAVDLLSEEGGTASLPSEGDATAALGAAPAERLLADLRAGLDELARRVPDQGLAAIGFCFGGGMVWQLLAAGEPRLAAAVPFYGPAPSDADFSGSPNAAVLGVYAGNDDRVNASRETARAALTAAGLTHEIRTFDGVDHAFFNDSGPRYDQAAAAEAYQAMLGWFDTQLAAPS